MSLSYIMDYQPKQSDIDIQHPRQRLFCFYTPLLNVVLSFDAKIDERKKVFGNIYYVVIINRTDTHHNPI